MRFVSPVLTVCALAVASHAAPAGPSAVPGDAKWAIHAAPAAFFESELGEAIRASERGERLAARVKLVGRMIGLDPYRDIESVTLYGLGYQRDRGVAVVRGELDREALLTAARANDRYERLERNGLVVHRWARRGRAGKGALRFGTFHGDGTLLIAPDPALLARGVSALESGAGGDAGLLPEASAGTYLTAGARDLPEKRGRRPRARLLRAIRGLSLEVGESGDETFLRVSAEAADDDDGERLRRALGGLHAFVALIAKESERERRPIDALRPVIGAMSVGGAERTAALSLRMETGKLFTALREARRLREERGGTSDE